MKRSLPLLVFSIANLIGGAALAPPAHGQPKRKESRADAGESCHMATGLAHPWSLAWLPNGDILVRSVPGGCASCVTAGSIRRRSRVCRKCMRCGCRPDGDSAASELRAEQIVYLTYTKDVADNMVATTLARGRFDGKQLLDVKDILVCDPWAGDGGSGARLAWGKDGMLYMTTGASNGNAAQSRAVCAEDPASARRRDPGAR